MLKLENEVMIKRVEITKGNSNIDLCDLCIYRHESDEKEFDGCIKPPEELRGCWLTPTADLTELCKNFIFVEDKE